VALNTMPISYPLNGYTSSAGCDHLIKEETVKGLDEASGVGVVVTPEMVKAGVATAIESQKAAILAKRYRFTPGILFGTSWLQSDGVNRSSITLASRGVAQVAAMG
jgi:hypothetical protein